MVADAPGYDKETKNGMGTFYTSCVLENPADRQRTQPVAKMLVDTGAEYTWVPAKVLDALGVRREDKQLSFRMADGRRVTRNVGFAVIRVDSHFTVDEVVFGHDEDLSILGARSLEGLNLMVDTQRKMLVGGGPIPAAAVHNLPKA